MIASSINHALLAHDLPSEDRTLSDLLASVMAGAGFGLILVTADRRIVYANDTADALMHARSGLRHERNCISAMDFTSTRKLRRARKAKTIVEVLAMIANAHPPLAPHWPRPVLEADERLIEMAAEFCAALEKCAERAKLKRVNH